jgi:glycosyltransferase involved in cell wall biosynthesis
MNILHLQPRLNLTCGISKTIYLIAKNLSDTSNQYVYTLGGDAIEKFMQIGIDPIVSKNRATGFIQSVKIFFDILKLVKVKKIEIIHSHHRYFDFIAFIVSAFYSVGTITSIHSKVHGKKFLSYKAKYFIACSNNIKQHLIDYFGISPKLIEVIYNFVDINEVKISLDNLPLRKELKINDDEIVVGFIGRFSKLEKGIDVLLESFRTLTTGYRNIILLLIGDGEDKNLILNFINKEHLRAHVLNPKENIYDFYNIIDIVVLPSKVDPFPLVMLESGLMKKAFIGSDIDGIKEFIENGKNGMLVKCGK